MKFLLLRAFPSHELLEFSDKKIGNYFYYCISSDNNNNNNNQREKFQTGKPVKYISHIRLVTT